MKVFSPRKLNELLNDPRVRCSGVAKVAKISTGALSEIRNGKRDPRTKTLAAIAAALNKPIDFFLEEEDVVHQHQLFLESKEVANG